MPGRKRRVRSTGASHSSRTCRSSSSRSDSWNGPPVAKPALLTSTSTRRSGAIASRSAGSVRSRAITSAWTACSRSSSAASSRSRSSRRATSVTLCPAAASRRANSRPMPDEAPVTSAVAAGSGAGKPMSGPYPRLQVAQRPFHDRVGDRTPQRTGHEAARIDAQVELDPRARAPVDRDEAPLARKVAEVAAGILAAEPLRRVVDLAQPVAHRLHARVDLELDEAAATLLVALEHAHRLDRLLPLGQALEVGQQVEAPL